MPARRPEPPRRIQLPAAVAPPEPSPELMAARQQRRADQVLRGGPMRLVIDAAITAGGSIEVETDTHRATITVVEK